MVFLAASLAPFVIADDLKNRQPTITVTGIGKLTARPDIAEVRVGVTTSAESAQDALAKNNSAMARLIQTIKERGVPEKDIQTAHLQLSPIYSQPRLPNETEFVPRVVGYRVENSLTVIARKIESLGPLLDALVQSGANQIQGIAFRINDSSKLLDEARKLAVANARRKAQLLAGEAGVVVGSPLEIHDQGGSEHSPQPVYTGARMYAMGASAAVPISPGEQEIIANVMIIYELNFPK